MIAKPSRATGPTILLAIALGGGACRPDPKDDGRRDISAADSPAPSASAVLALLGDDLRGSSSMAHVRGKLPRGLHRHAHGPLDRYAFCRGALDPASCDRLDGDRPSACREIVAQVRARAAGTKPWFGVPTAIEMCRAQAPLDACNRYASAVEAGDVAGCRDLPTALADCAALASGDGTRCVGLGREEAACRRAAVEIAALRTGIPAAEALEEGNLSAVAHGHLSGERGCDDLLSQDFTRALSR